MRKGFSLIELLITIGILGILAVVILFSLNPIEALARTRDAGRISSVVSLGHSLERYLLAQGRYPTESSSWITDVLSAGEIKTEPGTIDYSVGGISACDVNSQNNYCYQASTPNGGGPILVFARLESKSNISKCGKDAWAYIVYSSAEGSAGIVCSSQSSAIAGLTPGNQNFAISFNSSGCKNSSGNVEVVIPGGGESFNVGDSVEIQWCLNDYSKYNQGGSEIWLASRQTQADGSFVYQNQVQIANNVLMLEGLNSINWTIPTDPGINGGSFVILVTIAGWGSDKYDYSNDTFIINGAGGFAGGKGGCASSKGNVQVLIPNDGESYKVGDTVNLTWCVNDYSQYNQSYASVWLASRQTQANGTYVYQNQAPIAQQLSMQPGLNNYSWTIPASWSYVDPQTKQTITFTISGSSYVVLVNINSFNPNYDYSDNIFTITNPSTARTPSPSTACANSTGNVQVLVPNGGQSYKYGDTIPIDWCVNDISQYNQNYTSIWLVTRSSSGIVTNQVQIASKIVMTAGENKLDWVIPPSVSAGGNYTIRVNINSFNPNYDYGDTNFSIGP